MKKILLIGVAKTAPYVDNYIDLFVSAGVVFDYVYWNRGLEDTSTDPSNYHAFNCFEKNSFPVWKRAINNWRYTNFVKNWMKLHKYDYVIFFTISYGMFLSHYVHKSYKGHYIFDIRDYSPLCDVKFFKPFFKRLIKESAFTVISSRGFLKWLPHYDVDKYVVDHNIPRSLLTQCLCAKNEFHNIISILTIGLLRDYDSNSTLIDRLSNNRHYKLIFSGTGVAESKLKHFAEVRGVNNIEFTGRYIKREEPSIVNKADLLNIFFFHDTNSDSLMSNRFYLSVFFGKPMLVTRDTYQEELMKKYNLGISLTKDDNFNEVISNYIDTFNTGEYENGRISFMKEVINDVELFNDKVLKLLTTCCEI